MAQTTSLGIWAQAWEDLVDMFTWDYDTKVALALSAMIYGFIIVVVLIGFGVVKWIG